MHDTTQRPLLFGPSVSEQIPRELFFHRVIVTRPLDRLFSSVSLHTQIYTYLTDIVPCIRSSHHDLRSSVVAERNTFEDRIP